MIPRHVVTLIVVLATLWLIFRVGVPLFLLFAFVHFWNGAFFNATFALAIAMVIQAIKSPILVWPLVVYHHRTPWLLR